jgi:hypothetical protein
VKYQLINPKVPAKKNSLKVDRPNTITTTIMHDAITKVSLFRSRLDKMAKELPHRIIPRAVLTIISPRLGNPLLSGAMLNSQPTSADTPRSATKQPENNVAFREAEMFDAGIIRPWFDQLVFVGR